jgi:hypothetical protein
VGVALSRFGEDRVNVLVDGTFGDDQPGRDGGVAVSSVCRRHPEVERWPCRGAAGQPVVWKRHRAAASVRDKIKLRLFYSANYDWC